MKLFVMRHGETCMNNLNQVCGIIDVPLSEKGKLQAIEAAEKLKQKLNNTKINAVYVSPLIRTTNCRTSKNSAFKSRSLA